MYVNQAHHLLQLRVPELSLLSELRFLQFKLLPEHVVGLYKTVMGFKQFVTQEACLGKESLYFVNLSRQNNSVVLSACWSP